MTYKTVLIIFTALVVNVYSPLYSFQVDLKDSLMESKVEKLNTKFDTLSIQLQNYNNSIELKLREIIYILFIDNLIYIIIIIIFILLLLFLFYYLLFRKIKLLLNWQSYINQSLKNNSEKANNELNNIEISKIKTSLFEISNRLETIQKRLDILESNSNANPVSEISSKQSSPLLFFSPAPEQNGCFLEKNLTSQIANDSLFMISPSQKNINVAVLTILSDNPIACQRAINGINLYLEPVCDYLFNIHKEIKLIKQKEPGIVEKKNNNWCIKNKIKIEFE